MIQISGLGPEIVGVGAGTDDARDQIRVAVTGKIVDRILAVICVEISDNEELPIDACRIIRWVAGKPRDDVLRHIESQSVAASLKYIVQSAAARTSFGAEMVHHESE